MVARIKDNTTRREFVKEVTCTACIGTIVGKGIVAAAYPKTPANNEKLVAPCGLYCGACPMYLASQDHDEKKMDELVKQFSGRGSKMAVADLQCDGCIGGGRVASFCRACAMRTCAENTKKVTRCADCPDFPCSKITNFNNDGMLHHAEVLENCRKLKEAGIQEWAKREEARWRCPQCRANIAWYDKTCSQCGAKRSEKLFPLKQA
jgi:hypothetical protein